MAVRFGFCIIQNRASCFSNEVVKKMSPCFSKHRAMKTYLLLRLSLYCKDVLEEWRYSLENP
jgi:hypothetical protein